MKLYHGTNAEGLYSIMEHGILPRSERDDADSNWEANPSHPEAVYLTTAYAGYFAMCAADSDDPRWGIIEVDTEYLDIADLLPDEDFLEQATRGQEIPEAPEFDELREMIDLGMQARTAWFKDHIHGWAHLWRDSVEHLGTCSHLGAIDGSAITRAVLFDPKKAPGVAGLNDPSISLLNYKIMGAQYREYTRFLAGYAPDLSQFLAHFTQPDRLADVFKAAEDARLIVGVAAE